jgi:hypothetical protein
MRRAVTWWNRQTLRGKVWTCVGAFVVLAALVPLKRADPCDIFLKKGVEAETLHLLERRALERGCKQITYRTNLTGERMLTIDARELQ